MRNLVLASTIGDRLKEVMLPEKVNFFGLELGPSFFSAVIVSASIILFCLIIRVFFIKKFSDKPTKLQIILESVIDFFEGITNESIHKYKGFISIYIFTAAFYICLGTLIELLGLRPVLSDINACIAMALFTYGQLVIYSLINKGIVKGSLNSIKDLTIAISFSFRLFGSILSGLMIMELVYSVIWISFVIPAFLHVIFTLFHAFIQAYVFAMLSSLFLGEAIGEKELMVEMPKKLKISNT
ncbi:MAG: F0F1 ATP synthase subunit A [Bacilli bacterium]|nr:F0F1 ATP synthase subunit A [Bacilli bacterium]